MIPGKPTVAETSRVSAPSRLWGPPSNVFIAAMVLLCGIFHVHAKSDPLPEYRVKAAVIYKLVKFVRWPPLAFSSVDPSLRICVLGEDPFGEYLEVISGKTVHGRPVETRRVGVLESVSDDCHAVFVSQSEGSSVDRIVRVLDSRAILTIGDMPRFCNRGGMINFITADRRVRFEINVDATRRAGLKVDSRLLDLAIIVREEGVQQ